MASGNDHESAFGSVEEEEAGAIQIGEEVFPLFTKEDQSARRGAIPVEIYLNKLIFSHTDHMGHNGLHWINLPYD